MTYDLTPLIRQVKGMVDQINSLRPPSPQYTSSLSPEEYRRYLDEQFSIALKKPVNTSAAQFSEEEQALAEKYRAMGYNVDMGGGVTLPAHDYAESEPDVDGLIEHQQILDYMATHDGVDYAEAYDRLGFG